MTSIVCAGRTLAGATIASLAMLAPAAFAQVDAASPATDEAIKAPAAAPLPRWSLQFPGTGPVAFKGVVSFDEAGVGGGGMLYPAPSAAGLLAAVITHGLINESSKNAQKTKLQQKADEVLVPYKAVLSTYTHAELASQVAATGQADVSGGATEAQWLVESAPVFALTQDQTALVLENAVRVRKPGSTGPAVYERVIKVVSSPMTESDSVAYWTRDNGARLRQITGELMRESADLAVSMAAKTLPGNVTTQKSFRYFEGKTEKVERAGLVVERCTRRVLLTLREDLISVPFPSSAETCGTTAVANSSVN
ncbi:hypothetical protein ACSFBF_31810 [Variovorax sp. ZT5P49]|uniref:hypothetical protein n=1 Tax=Variovorax sp. ZT5P49 TaxID=3443733 RepID=UPI003F46FF71